MATFNLTTNDSIFVNNGDTVVLPLLASVHNGKQIYIQVLSGTAILEASGDELINYSSSSMTLASGNYFATSQLGNGWFVVEGIGLTGVIADGNFTSTDAGDVPASGGGTSNFLRADGSWAVPLDTDANITLSLFTTSASGEVPASGGGTSNFLRADGTWTTPAGTSDPDFNTITTVPGSTSGNLYWSMPEQSLGHKKVIIGTDSFNDAGSTIVFPTSFTVVPALLGDTTNLSIISLSISSVIVSSTSVTSTTIIEGF